jgi:hypothetical protein
MNEWDILLVAVVSLQATALAYLRAPRWKALAFTFPFPFTILALSMDRPLGAAHMLALSLVFVFIHCVRLVHQRAKVPILPAIALGVLVYASLGWFGARWLPDTATAFWAASALVIGFGAIAYLKIPGRTEPGHRTLLPLWKKLPLIVLTVFFLVQLKPILQGFATLFPMIGILVSYEARHSLWTIGRQMPVLILTMGPLMVTVYLLQSRLGLACGWVVFLAILIPFTRRQWAVSS